MARNDRNERAGALAQLAQELPLDRLRGQAEHWIAAAGERVVSVAEEHADQLVERLTQFAEDPASPGLMAAVSGGTALAQGKSPLRAAVNAGGTLLKEKIKSLFGGGGGASKLKLTNIVESIDVGAPLRVVYDQWTQFGSFPGFMKKVESVEHESDEKATWKAQVLWSHRTWRATITEQVADQHVVWRSTGAKGHVDGAVTFHALTPNLTRVLVVLEYHPKGLFEKTGNLWRAQGRRVRLELKHFRRHVMTRTLSEREQIEGWRGEIRDGEVVTTHQEALEEE
ncbi:SRPBCC family protein, partial [Streptacidiphilus neutrinimicus]|uniref:SRPBCC family protein n=1 Tax=Streptacidiphilus neutrinimicus TaxID=105420 RepID=UPI0005A6D729